MAAAEEAPDRPARFMVAWDGSEIATLALKATIHSFVKPGDRVVVYHCSNAARHAANYDAKFAPESLTALLQDAGVSTDVHDVVFDEKNRPDDKISEKILRYAAKKQVDFLVMGDVGTKAGASRSVQV